MEVRERNPPLAPAQTVDNNTQAPQNAPVPPQMQMTEQQVLALLRERNAAVPDPSQGIALPNSVTKLISPLTGARVFLVGTAHVSTQSSVEVRKVIRDLKPQQVILELCPSRRMMIDPILNDLKKRFEEAARNGMSPLDLIAEIKREEDEKEAKSIADAQKPADEKKDTQAESSSSSQPSENQPEEPKKNRFWDWLRDSYTLVRSNSPGSWFAVLLTGLYKRVEGQLKIETGLEMRTGALEAALVGAKILLGDRPIRITLNRTWSAMSLWQKIHFAGSLVLAAFSSISAEDIESLKQDDLLESVIKELTDRYPSLAKHVVEERDQYLAQTIRSVPGPIVVAIVGAAHVPGIKANWEKEIDMQALLSEPAPSVAISVTKKLVKLGFYLLIPLTLAYFFWWR